MPNPKKTNNKKLPKAGKWSFDIKKLSKNAEKIRKLDKKEIKINDLRNK